MNIKIPCSLEFHPAYHLSGMRDISDIHWIVLHDEESPTARSAAEYFKNPLSGGSAHLCVDDKECYRCLRDIDIPWGASSAPSIGANTHGFHIEQAGYANWLPKRWMLHPKTLERTAFKIAIHALKFDLPIEFVDYVDLVAYGKSGLLKRGITTHRAISKASQILDPNNKWKYTHSDPGVGYPRYFVLKRAQHYLDELNNV